MDDKLSLLWQDEYMPAKKKPATKKATPKRPLNIDPNLLARDVMEAFLGEPLTEKPKHKAKKK